MQCPIIQLLLLLFCYHSRGGRHDHMKYPAMWVYQVYQVLQSVDFMQTITVHWSY